MKKRIFAAALACLMLAGCGPKRTDPVQARLQVGIPPTASPEDLRQNLIRFGSQFDNITIK